MIDIHTHVLQHMDDGAADENIALEMLRIAVVDGITEIIATPHSQVGKEIITRDEIDREVAALNRTAEKEGLNITVSSGCEWSVVSGIPELINKGYGCPLAGGRYVLLELAPWQDLSFYNNAIYEIMIAGYVPILAHVERYNSVLKHPGDLSRAIRKGVLVQVNANSICGNSGRKVRAFVMNLIKHRMVHFVSSDAHNTDNRAPVLSKAYGIVEKKFGAAMAEKLFYTNGFKVINDEQIYSDDPVYIR